MVVLRYFLSVHLSLYSKLPFSQTTFFVVYFFLTISHKTRLLGKIQPVIWKTFLYFFRFIIVFLSHIFICKNMSLRAMHTVFFVVFSGLAVYLVFFLDCIYIYIYVSVAILDACFYSVNCFVYQLKHTHTHTYTYYTVNYLIQHICLWLLLPLWWFCWKLLWTWGDQQ